MPSPRRHILVQHMFPMKKGKKQSITQVKDPGVKHPLIPLSFSHGLWLASKHVTFHKYLSRNLILSVHYDCFYYLFMLSCFFFFISSDSCLVFWSEQKFSKYIFFMRVSCHEKWDYMPYLFKPLVWQTCRCPIPKSLFYFLLINQGFPNLNEHQNHLGAY